MGCLVEKDSSFEMVLSVLDNVMDEQGEVDGGVTVAGQWLIAPVRVVSPARHECLVP